MKRVGAALAIVLSIGCSRQPEGIRLTGSSSLGITQQDHSVRSQYSFDLTMPTHGQRYELRDFVLIDRAGRAHTPTALQVVHSSERPDVATPTFELGDIEPAELRVGAWRHSIHGGTQR